MKNKIILPLLAAGVFAIGLASCSREAIYDRTPQTNDFSNSAIVKFYNAALGTNRTFIYVDGQQVNGTSILYGSAFPAHSSDYGFVVEPGLRAFVVKDTLSSSTQAPMNFSENFQANGKYTMFMYDTMNATKHITVPTDIVIPADTTSRIRFAYFWRTAVGQPPAVDVFSKALNQNIASNLGFSQVTDFITYPSNTSDTLLIHEAGTSNLLAQVNSYSTTQKRNYTLVLRGGFYTTTGTNARTVSSVTEY
jgi:hypothetical protein